MDNALVCIERQADRQWRNRPPCKRCGQELGIFKVCTTPPPSCGKDKSGCVSCSYHCRTAAQCIGNSAVRAPTPTESPARTELFQKLVDMHDEPFSLQFQVWEEAAAARKDRKRKETGNRAAVETDGEVRVKKKMKTNFNSKEREETQQEAKEQAKMDEPDASAESDSDWGSKSASNSGVESVESALEGGAESASNRGAESVESASDGVAESIESVES